MNPTFYTPCNIYTAGRWLVTHYALKFRLRNGTADAGESFVTLGDAMVAADVRNGGLS